MEQHKLPVRIQIELYSEKIRAIRELANNIIFVIATKLPESNDKQAAMLRIYNRMNLLVESVLHLEGDKHYQTIGSITRSIFEMFIDISSLFIDKTGETFDRYIKFSEIEIFRWGKAVNEFYKENPEMLKFDNSTYMWAENSDVQKKIKQNVDQYWPKAKNDLKKVQRWSKESRLALCQHLDKEKPTGRDSYICFEEMYVMIYSRLSWLIHSGESGTLNFNKQMIELTVCESLLNIEDIFCETTLIISRAIINEPQLNDILRTLFDVLDNIDNKYKK